jgi:hypothetical protein
LSRHPAVSGPGRSGCGLNTTSVIVRSMPCGDWDGLAPLPFSSADSTPRLRRTLIASEQ